MVQSSLGALATAGALERQWLDPPGLTIANHNQPSRYKDEQGPCPALVKDKHGTVAALACLPAPDTVLMRWITLQCIVIVCSICSCNEPSLLPATRSCSWLSSLHDICSRRLGCSFGPCIDRQGKPGNASRELGVHLFTSQSRMALATQPGKCP